MPGIAYPSSVTRTIGDKFGERISVLDFGAVGDGVTDNSAAFAAAIAASNVAGGCEILVPKGTYLVNSSITLSSAITGVTFNGDGANTIILRGAALAAGVGLFDISGHNIGFKNLLVDGGVTTSVGMMYSAITGGDPMLPALTQNTSFWVHGGSRGISFSNVTVQHTGGYAILLDATTASINDVRILDSTFQNNRPHLFGNTSGDLNYGSWTGGIHYQGDGNNYAVGSLLVRHCTFLRNTGHCVWGHLYALNYLHRNIQVSGNNFEDCGLDGVLTGGVSGGLVDGNRFRRMGYICTSDTSVSVPKFLAWRYSCAVDTAGLVRGVNYTNNTFMSVNGGCMDLDGYCQGTVSGNTCIVPAVGEPEYTEDSIAISGAGGAGANWVYGIQPSNSNNAALPGSNITVVGNTFVNIGGGAIKMFGARNCLVQGNNVNHPANANYPPISIGNIGTGPYQQATGNVITANQIAWGPATLLAAIIEDSSAAAFTSSDKNWVSGNLCSGNCFEFQKDANSGSGTGVTVSSQSNGLTTRSENLVQREGVGTSAVYRVYQNTVSGSPAFSSLFDVLQNSVPTPIGGPLFNVSNNGGTGTGSFSTAGRTQSAIDDAVLTGKVWADGFAALTDSSYVAAQANLMPATVGVLRYDSVGMQFLQSNAVSGGARVWTPLSPWTVSGASIYYNGGTVGIATTTPSSSYALDVNGLAHAVTAMVSSTLTNALNVPYGGVSALTLTATSVLYNAVQAASGGLFAGLGVTANQAFYPYGWASAASLNTPAAGYGGLGYKSGSVYWYWNGSAWASVDLSIPAGYAYGAAAYFTTLVLSSTLTNALAVASGGVTALTLTATSVLYNAVQAASGGLFAGLGVTANQAFYPYGWASAASLNTPAAGYGGLGYKSGSVYWYWNGSAWASVDLSISAGYAYGASPYFATVQIPNGAYYYGTDNGGTPRPLLSMHVDNNVYLDNTALSNDVYIRPASGRYVFMGIGSAEYVCPNGNLTASLGTASYRWNTLYVQSIAFSSSGGYSAGTGISVSGPTITNTGVTSLSGYTGACSLGAGTGISLSGLTIYNAGVTSIGGYTGACNLSAGTGVSVSGLTVSIGQPVGTGNAVSFAGVTTTGTIQSTASGYAVGFQGNGGTFQVNGIGDISGGGKANLNGGYQVASAWVINSAGAFVSAGGVNVGSAGISCGGYAINGGFYGGFFTFQDLAGVTHTVKGGILIS